jgi:hypothetical protein
MAGDQNMIISRGTVNEFLIQCDFRLRLKAQDNAMAFERIALDQKSHPQVVLARLLKNLDYHGYHIPIKIFAARDMI